MDIRNNKTLALNTSDPLKDTEEMKKLILNDMGFQLTSIFWKLKLEHSNKKIKK